MKIIKQVDVSNWTYRFTCQDCDSELEADHNDIKSGGDGHGGVEFYVYCSICHTKTDVNTEDVPKALQIKVKNKSSSYYD